MGLLTNDPLTQLAFSLYENKGVFTLLIGSGLSRSAEIPTGWEITLDLIRRVALAKGVKDQQDWAKWYKDQTGAEPDYSALLAELATSPDERRAILHSYIEPSEEDREQGRKLPTPAHHAIAALVRGGYIRVIITTNFDRLMENALRERGIEPTVVSSLDALRGAEPIVHSTCYVLKLHGDYKDARIRNINEELSEYPPEYNALLDRIFDEHGLIVSGWSGEWDHALRAAILRAPNRRYPLFWMAQGTLRASAQELIDHRKGRVVTAPDANAFFGTLQQRVETLEQTHQKNPRSIELLVNTTKRYLGKPEYRIQLDELISQEANHLIEQMDSPEFAPQGPATETALRARVKAYEAITEGLARMAGVLGRWGDGTELPLVLDLLRTLYAHAEKVGAGTVVYPRLRSYPVVLIFTAYGLGLARAQRWKTLHALFTAELARESRQQKRVVECLFLWAWKGGDKNYWNCIEGLEQRKTPLSDYLLSQFTEWGSIFLSLLADRELLCERYELLGSLAHLERHSEAELEAFLQSDDRRAWMPMGRAGWDSSNFEILVAELQSSDFRDKLCKAGFAHSSPKFLDLFIANATRFAEQMSW